MIVNPAILSEFMETKLNEAGASLSQKFLCYYWVKEVDKSYTIDNTGDPVVEDNIIAYITDLNGQYRPIPNVNVCDENFILNIFYPIDKQEVVEVCLDNLIVALVGNDFTITSNQQSIDTAWNVDNPNFASVQKQSLQELVQNDGRFVFDETKIYGLVQLRCYFVATDVAKLGNKVKYYMCPEIGATSYFTYQNYQVGEVFQLAAPNIPYTSIQALGTSENATDTWVLRDHDTAETYITYKGNGSGGWTATPTQANMPDYPNVGGIVEIVATSGNTSNPDILILKVPIYYGTELKRIETQPAYVGNDTPEQLMGATTSKTIVSSNNNQLVLNVIYDGSFWQTQLLQRIFMGIFNQNAKYYLTKTWLGAEWTRQTCLITGVSVSEPLGNIITFGITLKRASDLL